MGGIFILGLVIINCLLWCDLTKLYVWIFLATICMFGALGGWDDWCKIKYKKGIPARTKFLLQLAAGFIAMSTLMFLTPFSTIVVIPFFKTLTPDIGYFFLLWGIFIIVAMSNAVNLTDGLDGLAIGSLMQNFATFGIIAYMAGHFQLAHYLGIPFAGTAEVAIIASILVGASIGFLWYNAYPAQIFMGDVGSLALGAGLALIAIMAKQELLLCIAGGLFVIETLSVIAQVLSVKLRGKRIFKMAPLHHHFELLGWPEAKIVVRFGIISFVLCLLALITLKIR
jgi:phospho-N-acetylmuramoyl-pentapeptide-transferase